VSQDTNLDTNSTVEIINSVPIAENDLTVSLIAGHLSPHTRRAYAKDAQEFTNWVAQESLSLETLTKGDILRYRRFLVEHFAKATAARKLVVARKFLEEAVERGILTHNPAHKVAGYKNASGQETPHQALGLEEARALLGAIDISSRQGKRDYAIMLLLLRTGLRRSECAALQWGDLGVEILKEISGARLKYRLM
jgi:integrase/recombinase XerD